MSERLTITPLGPYIGAQVSGLDVTRPLSDNQFEQLYHAVLRHQVVFLREQAITPVMPKRSKLAWRLTTFAWSAGKKIAIFLLKKQNPE